jgi:steroid delta-isomerase-like uncharacterized protein
MVSQDNIAVIRQAIQTVNNRDFATAAQFVTPDYVRHDLAGAIVAKKTGREEATDFLQTFFKAFPNLQIHIEDIFASGDRVTVRYNYSGTHEGDLFGIAPTGAEVDFSGINIYRFEVGKIAEAWQLWDWATVLRQIGVLDVFDKT